MKKDLYEILKIPRDATPDQVKEAYRFLVKQHHPDVQGDEAIFKEISTAYEVLSDSEKRARYDEFGMDDEEMNQVMEMAKGMFSAAIDKDPEDIMCEVRQVYSERTRQLDSQKDVIKQGIQKAERILDAMEESPENDFIGTMLRKEVVGMEADIENLVRVGEILCKAMDTLSEYRFAPGPEIPGLINTNIFVTTGMERG